MLISERIHEIPSPNDLLQRLIAYAKIDRIMNPDSDDCMVRVYHYDKDWVPGGHFLKIDDSGGDHYHVLFSPDGCIVKGFDHESDLSPYNYNDEDEPMLNVIAEHDFYDGAPVALSCLLDDPALEKELATFCAWQAAGDSQWHCAESEIPADWSDGIETFLFYAQDPEEYRHWFEAYYETKVDLKIIRDIADGKSVTAEMARSLNPEGDVDLIMKELGENF